MNTLFYGDNLNILRRYIRDESVDLVYLDPPFNSNRNYNVLFKDESGMEADSQIMAFEDTWHWKGAASTYHDLLLEGDKVSEMLQAFHSFIGENQMMAYLVMMAVRLKELHRVLKPTGSLYLHCDPTASHYLKILLDAIFGGQNFKNEIAWQRTSAHNDPSRYGRVHDLIFFYSKSNSFTWNQQFDIPDKRFYNSHDFEEDENGRLYRKRDLTAPGHGNTSGQYEWRGKLPPAGRMWSYTRENMAKLEEDGRIVYTKTGMPRLKIYDEDLKGVPYQDIWAKPELWLNSAAQERLPYPTQKPVALLERIISSSSSEGDVVLDPFAGCGTTTAAAQKLNRKWIGIDITQLSIALLKNRLDGNFGWTPLTGKLASQARRIFAESGMAALDALEVPEKKYLVVGEPTDMQGAKQLALEDRYQFQYWALSLIQARPLGGQTDGRTGKKGSDKGIDGIKVFVDDNSGKAKRVIVQVNSGHVKSGDIRDLVGTLDREGGAIGVFITLEKATSHMIDEAASAGFFTSEHFGKFPRIQILTIEDLLGGKTLQMPQSLERTFKQAERIRTGTDDQPSLLE